VSQDLIAGLTGGTSVGAARPALRPGPEPRRVRRLDAALGISAVGAFHC
jgi:hypothetical protein